jgi:hypothetical protein
VSLPLLSLWRQFVPPAVALAGLLTVALFASRGIDIIWYAWIGLAIVAMYRRFRWLRPLGKKVRSFHTFTNDRIRLHCAPALTNRWDVSLLMGVWQQELERLEQRFGFALRRRVVVFLFPSWHEIASTFGPQYGGTAMPLANAIFIAEDNNVRESLRHELVHLFAAKWNAYAPPILAEGLCVWLQRTQWGTPIDSVARRLLSNPSLSLTMLLKPTLFFSDQHRHCCYVLAGSFTRFLIRRFGWENYQWFFRQCDGTQFERRFASFFGISLEQAERQWRTEVIAMDVLNRQLETELCS